MPDPADSSAVQSLTNLADALNRWTTRYVPSALSIAVLISVFTFLLAMTWGGATASAAFAGWAAGLWELLSFSMQMALVMFSGSLLAQTPAVQSLLRRVASTVSTPRGAVVLMAMSSMTLAYFNWGLSIIAAAMLVRFVARRVPTVDYRLLVACAYFGLGATWHAGLSASAPLLVATPKHFLEAQLGVIGLEKTLFSPFNLTLLVVVMGLLVLFAWVLHPPPGQVVSVDPALLPPTETTRAVRAPIDSVSRFLDETPALNALLGGALLIAFALQVWDSGWQRLNLNGLNLLFLGLGVGLHRSPADVLKAGEEAGASLSGIVLQFPLYAGMYGVFKATGLTEKLGELFVSISTQQTFPAVVYVYSGIVNYFVPSGGAKWAIEGPYLLSAAKSLGVAPEKIVLAYAWGDMATDLIQPFWAIPLLGIARLEFKDVLGFLLLVFAAYMPLVTLAFLFFG